MSEWQESKTTTLLLFYVLLANTGRSVRPADVQCLMDVFAWEWLLGDESTCNCDLDDDYG